MVSVWSEQKQTAYVYTYIQTTTSPRNTNK